MRLRPIRTPQAKRTGACADPIFQALPRAETLTELLLRKSKDGDRLRSLLVDVLFGGLANPNTVWVARFRRCRGGKGPPSCPQPAPASRGRSWSWTTGVSRAA